MLPPVIKAGTNTAKPTITAISASNTPLSLKLSSFFSRCSREGLASCAASAVVWILHGQVLWALAIPALACSIAGNYLGALYAIRGGSKKIRSVMFLVLGLLFVKMLYELLF